VEAPERPDELGFPDFATKNTTRIGSPSPPATAAAAALAVFPSTGGVPGPAAVSVVDAADWPAGIAAASLVAAPVGAPLLVAEDGELGELGESAIRELGPEGSARTDGSQIFALGAAAGSTDLDELAVEGANPAEVAARVLELRARLAGKPEHIVVTSSDDPAYAMPAAGWAARSGDPVLFVGRETVPDATAKALERYRGTPVYVLGPTTAISAATLRRLERLAPTAERVGADGAVANAIEFARFASGSFGWNINDPGHGFVIANGSRPLDAGAAAPLSASGTWGPLLVVEDGEAVPAELRGYLLDLKPGYEDDPTRALYNHIWLIGDPSAISVDFQAQVDELAELVPVTSGPGTTGLVPGPGAVESSPDEPAGDGERDDQQR
jgi:ell wall binding domain 2 (CWB2)